MDSSGIHCPLVGKKGSWVDGGILCKERKSWVDEDTVESGPMGLLLVGGRKAGLTVKHSMEPGRIKAHSVQRLEAGQTVAHSVQRLEAGQIVAHSVQRLEAGQTVAHSVQRLEAGQTVAHSVAMIQMVVSYQVQECLAPLYLTLH